MTVINGISEEILIQRLINGDQTAYELLFRFYYPGLVTFSSHIVLDYDEAEEIVQDFFVRLWTNRDQIKASATLKNYFFLSIKNRSLNYLKKVKIGERIREKLKVMVENDQLYDPDLFVESELQERIQKAIKKLPPRTHEIFMLSRFDGHSNAQIADRFGISKRTVETQISNAMKLLRQELKEHAFLMMLF